MKHKLLAIIALSLPVIGAHAQLVAFPAGTNDQSAGGVAATTIATGADSTNLVRGSGLTPSSGSGSTEASTDGRTTTSTFASSVTTSPGKYYSFTVSPEANYSLSFTNITATGTASGTGPTNAQWGYSINNFATGLGTASTLNTSGVATAAALTNTGITSATEFRFVGFRPSSAGGSGGTFRITAPTLTGTATLRSAGTLTWDGGQANANWNSYTGTAANQSNWNLNNIPASGLADSLVFAGTAQTSTTNNITGLTAASITFASGAGAFTNGGNSLTLTGGVTNSSTNLQTISHPLALSATAHVFNAASGNLTVSAAISGSGASIDKQGSNQLTLSAANSYTGSTTVTAGTLALSGAGTLGTGALTVASGAILDISGRTADYSFAGAVNGTGTLRTGTLRTLTLTGTLSPATASTAGALNVSGKVSLGSAATSSFDILSDLSFDSINIAAAGVFTLGGSLVLDFDTGWTLAEGTYGLFAGDGTLAGGFGAVSFGGQFTGSFTEITNGIWQATAGDGTFTFDESSGILTVAAVPEPHQYGLAMAAMLVAIMAVRLRSRHRMS